jgi:cyclophilin family peptidyl-prolyl cis-trans isomerase
MKIALPLMLLCCTALHAAPAVYRVKIETTAGDFVIEVHRDWAPRGADRFYQLVHAKFFDNSRFFRVVAGRWAQFGIAGDPKVAQRYRHQTIPDDPAPHQHNDRGYVAFAMTGPDQRTTQIYINYADNRQLEPEGFAPFGKVVEGMDVVEKLYSGYGETSGGGMRAGKQDHLFAEGNAYLDREFPKLDHLIRARILNPRVLKPAF